MGEICVTQACQVEITLYNNSQTKLTTSELTISDVWYDIMYSDCKSLDI